MFLDQNNGICPIPSLLLYKSKLPVEFNIGLLL